MATNLEQIKASLVNIAQGDDLFDMLLEFERTLDQTEIYAYLNWMIGEIIDGPHVSRYWFEVSLMYPHTKMPDPRGGLRLEKLGCQVKMYKDVFRKPERVLDVDDVADKKTKKAKITDIPVWIVKIKMPIKYIVSNSDDIEDYINDEIDKETEQLYTQYETSEEPNSDGLDSEEEL
jgi:hypothetical protein